MIKEKIQKFIELQNKGLSGPVPIIGSLTATFIIYPLLFVGFYLSMDMIENLSLRNFLFYTGIIIFVLNIIFLFEKSGFLRSIGSYLIYLTWIIYSTLTFSGLSGNNNLITLKILLPFIFVFILLIVILYLIDVDSEEILDNKSIDKVYKFLFGPVAFCTVVSMILAYAIDERYMSWMITFLNMLISPGLYTMLFRISYPLQHRKNK